MVASGPFLDIGGSYETGAYDCGIDPSTKASVLFEKLELVAEKSAS